MAFKMKIHADMLIEDLVRNYPESVGFLMEKHIKCIACGEPIWGTLREAAQEKGFTDREIQGLVEELKTNLTEIKSYWSIKT